MAPSRDLTITDSSDLSEIQITESSPSKKAKQSTKRPPVISYELFMSILHYTLCFLAIMDRFEWNVWPRQTYQIGRGSAGSDKMDGLKSGPWSVALYDILARLSGRFAILAYNFLLVTRMESVEWLFAETFVAKKFLDCRDIVNANIRMHRWNGIALCVLTLLHVWSILFPCLFHGYKAKVVPGKFEWPVSERTPPRCDYDNYVEGCWPVSSSTFDRDTGMERNDSQPFHSLQGDTDPVRKTMGLQVDDVFRMVEMTVFLAILMPISVRWLVNRWHAAIHLHRFIHIVYFVDIVRRHSHPHSWILNTPVFVLFYLDKWIFSFLHKRNNLPGVKRVRLSDNFMVLFWKSPFGKTDTVGPDYALRLHGTPIWEDKHPFTCFENRTGIAFNDDLQGDDWDVGVVIRVFRNKRTPQIGEKHSHTQRMYDEDDKDGLKMLITGPRQGEMSETVKFDVVNKPVVLIGAGSAINYILDAIQYCARDAYKPLHPVKVIYSTRDLELYKWCFQGISNLLQGTNPGLFDITMAYTGKDAGDISTDTFECFDEFRGTKTGEIKAVTGRVDFGKHIFTGSVVFCQGSGGIKDSVKNACQCQGAIFHGGLGGGS